MDKISCSVVICTFNRANLLSQALASLATQDYPPERFEILIVDNNSTDTTRDVIAKFCQIYTNVRGIFEAKQGLSHARNRGWQEARGEIVAYIDDDAKASSTWLRAIVMAFEKIHPTPTAVGGPIFPWYEYPPPSWFSDDFEIRSWGGEASFLDGILLARGLSGSNMAFLKKVLEKYGGFSPSFGMVGRKIRLGEEAELFHRISKSEPWFWYDPNAVVYHFVPARNMRITYQIYRSFLSGITRSQISGKEPFVVNKALKALKLAKYLVCCPLQFLDGKNRNVAGIVKVLKTLSYQLGSLL